MLRAELGFSVDGMTATGNGKSMVSVPWIGKNFGVVNFILGGCGLDKRKYPDANRRGLRLEGECLDQDGRRFRGRCFHARPVRRSMTIASATRKTSPTRTGTLDCSRELKLKVVEFSPKQYLTLKQTLKPWNTTSAKFRVLAVSESAAVPPA